MTKDEPLKPDDFPVHVKRNKLVKRDGKPIADVCDGKTAENIAERLNENAYRREEDRWSA